MTRQDNIDLSPRQDTIDKLAGIGQIQLYETNEYDTQTVSSYPIVAATPTSNKEVACSKEAGRLVSREGRKAISAECGL